MTLPARALALFVSDLHLQPANQKTCEAFFIFLQERAAAARALYLLGDIFEYWAGDDDLDGRFHQRVVQALRALSDGGVALYWIAGNRDFLVGAQFAAAAGLTLLVEPYVARIGGQDIALMHGDAACTNDVKYMEFRAMVRQGEWQAQFLAQPLAQRKAIIAGMREGSRAAQGSKSYQIMDVTPQAIDAVFAQTGCDVLIHGHTHRPALHHIGAKRRYVLPDWELDSEPVRGGWIEIAASGAITRYDVDGNTLS
ncbi:MAG: UDP-2,3-diacylglucosamine diphosphatase [Pseudomonadota bacterium]